MGARRRLSTRREPVTFRAPRGGDACGIDRDAWRVLLIVALLLAGFALKGAADRAAAAAARVAAGRIRHRPRALARLQRILGDQRPHPVDSRRRRRRPRAPDRRAARDRPPAAGPGSDGLQRACPSRAPSAARASATSSRRFRRRGPGQHLLLNAHYDSTPTGPGAADDGIGVATLLEVGAILKASPPPRPVTLLFNEGEEFGLNGAAAFVRGDPLAKQVNSLINIDGRGVTGPALMYETSDPNGAADRRSMRARRRRPYANSISTDFAKLIPNSTDVVFFKPTGWTMLNYGMHRQRDPLPLARRHGSPRSTAPASATWAARCSRATRAQWLTPEPAAGGVRTRGVHRHCRPVLLPACR